VSTVSRILDLLPTPYSVAADSVLAQLVNAFALEMDVLQEDIDRVRQTHWVETAYRLADLDKLAALVGVTRLGWESAATFRARLLPLVETRLNGALAPGDVREFVWDYLVRAERASEGTFVPGLQTVHADEAYAPPHDRPLFRPLRLVENPPRLRRSSALAARGGVVPYLFRWTEGSQSIDEAVVTFAVTGLIGRRTSVPILVNLTTGDLIGYADRLSGGHTVVVRQSGDGDDPRAARASIGDNDVTARLFSMGGFSLGVPFEPDDLDPVPLLPRQAPGQNEWIFLSVGLYDVRGLDRFFFAIADEALREAVFDETSFDDALFPSGPVARLSMEWIEHEPAAFEVGVPRHLVVEEATGAPAAERPHRQVGEALAVSIQELRAAGVRAGVRFVPFGEVQRQKVQTTLPWIVVDPERASPGAKDVVAIGARFGESGLGVGRLG
jgi:hypothetical protein